MEESPRAHQEKLGQEQFVKASAAAAGKSTRAQKVWSKIGFVCDPLLS